MPTYRHVGMSYISFLRHDDAQSTRTRAHFGTELNRLYRSAFIAELPSAAIVRASCFRPGQVGHRVGKYDTAGFRRKRLDIHIFGYRASAIVVQSLRRHYAPASIAASISI